MKQELIKDLKEKLEKERENIEKELKRFANKDESVEHDWDTRFPARADSESGSSALESGADQVEEYGNLLSLEHSLELRLKDISLALDKIEKKTYGKCENCKKDISIQRLKAYPAARICLSCEKK